MKDKDCLIGHAKFHIMIRVHGRSSENKTLSVSLTIGPILLLERKSSISVSISMVLQGLCYSLCRRVYGPRVDSKAEPVIISTGRDVGLSPRD